VSIRVVDNGAPPLSATQSFSITVVKTNSAPSLTPMSDKFVNEGALLTFTATAADSDVPAQQLTFSLDTNTVPPGAAINATNGVFTWTPDEAQGPGVYGVRVRVTDNGVPPMSDSSVVTIHVAEVNQAPVLANLADLAAALGETVSFTAHATDADLPAQLITFDFASPPPAGAAIVATNGRVLLDGEHRGHEHVFDPRDRQRSPALSDTKTFQIVVTASFTTSIAVSNNVVTLNWNAISGRTYNVEYKNNLSEGSWTPLPRTSSPPGRARH